MSFRHLIERIEYLERRLENADRRLNNMFREGVVTELDVETGTARVDAMDVVSKKVPWLQRAGDINEWDPPTVGERVLLFSPTGEPGVGMILPGGYSDKFPQPHNAGGEKVTAIGGVRVTQTGDSFTITAGGVTMTVSGDGVMIEGGEVKHNGHKIDYQHVHTQVEPGGGNSGPPP